MVCTKSFAHPSTRVGRGPKSAFPRQHRAGPRAPSPTWRPGDRYPNRPLQTLAALSEPFSAPTAVVTAAVAVGQSMVSLQDAITATA